MSSQSTSEPGSHRLADRVEIGTQTVIARHLDHCAPLCGGRDPKPITRSLHDEHRHAHRIELCETARGGRSALSAWRL